MGTSKWSENGGTRWGKTTFKDQHIKRFAYIPYVFHQNGFSRPNINNLCSVIWWYVPLGSPICPKNSNEHHTYHKTIQKGFRILMVILYLHFFSPKVRHNPHPNHVTPMAPSEVAKRESIADPFRRRLRLLQSTPRQAKHGASRRGKRCREVHENLWGKTERKIGKHHMNMMSGYIKWCLILLFGIFFWKSDSFSEAVLFEIGQETFLKSRQQKNQSNQNMLATPKL